MEPTQIRPAAVAGHFYPQDPAELKQLVSALLARAEPPPLAPRAIITPHAGLPYSGALAALAWQCATTRPTPPGRILLLGPSHRVYVQGLATSPATHWESPLGRTRLDREGAVRLEQLPQVACMGQAHAFEHSLEVQLPFIQSLFPEAQLLPLVVGDADPGAVAEVLAPCWEDPDTLIAISSDLSHFHDYASAQRIDGATARAIEQARIEDIGPEQACGCRPLNGLLQLSAAAALQITRLGLCNSGDTAGDKSRVVGYGAFAVH